MRATTDHRPRGGAPAQIARELDWLRQRSARFLESVEILWEIDFHHESRLADTGIGQVIVHVARCADDCADILYEHRTGRAAPGDDGRRWAEYPGGDRPGAVVIDDIVTALHRLDAEAGALAPEAWGVSGGIDRLAGDALVELIVHDLDLGVGDPIEPQVAAALLGRVVAGLAPDPGRARLTVDDADPAVVVVDEPDGRRRRVSGEPGDLLAWITDRPVAGPVQADDADPLPELARWHCHRRFERS